MNRRAHEEEDVRLPILEALEVSSLLTTQEITGKVRGKLKLFPADLEQANKRLNEQKIDQTIANALQDKRELCGDGLIIRVSRGTFLLTDIGRKYLADFRTEFANTSKFLDDIFPDKD